MSTEAEKIKEKHGITSEDFYSIKHVEDPQIAPNGTIVLYVLQEPNKEENGYNRSIWSIPAAGGVPKKFTAGAKEDFSPRWAPDGKRFAFVSTRAGKPQIFIIDTDGGEARQFTSLPNGAVNPVWSPDGRFIAFNASANEEERKKEDCPEPPKELNKIEKKCEEEKKKDKDEKKRDPRVVTRLIFRNGSAFRDDKRSHIYVQEVVEESKPRRLTNGEYDYGAPSFSVDGNFIFTWAHRSGNEDVAVRTDLLKFPFQGGEPVALTDDQNGNHSPIATPDGTSIIYMSFHAERLFEQRMSLRRIPIEGGVPEDLTDKHDKDVQPPFYLSKDGNSILFPASYRGEDRVYRYDLESHTITPVLAGQRFIKQFHIATDAPKLAYVVTNPSMPSDVFVSDIDGSNELRLTEINKKFLEERILSIPEEIWYKGEDGFDIQGWIMKPVGFEPGKRHPLLVQIHGGPHIMWGFEFWHEFQTFAAKGYVVFFCNPRGSDGYGRAFKGSIHLAWGQKDMRDILTGADEVVKRGYIDTDRMVVTGGSFGGYMTATIVANDHRFKAAVAQRGVYNLISLYGNSDAMTLVEWEFDTLPWENTQLLWQFSPIAHVEKVQTPLMICHSEQDYRAGIHTADELFVALRRLGKEAEFVRYPREGHELSRSGEPDHRIDRINRMASWFERHLPHLKPIE